MKARNADITYPLLDAVGTCLVEGTVGGDVMLNLGIGELLEGDIGGGRKSEGERPC